MDIKLKLRIGITWFLLMIFYLSLMLNSSTGELGVNIDFVELLMTSSFTLAGFCLVSGVFDSEKAQKVIVVRKLFESSRNFIYAGAFYLATIATSGLGEKTLASITGKEWSAITVVVGTYLFFTAIASLLIVLFSFNPKKTR